MKMKIILFFNVRISRMILEKCRFKAGSPAVYFFLSKPSKSIVKMDFTLRLSINDTSSVIAAIAE